jgi:hypothetical protein
MRLPSLWTAAFVLPAAAHAQPDLYVVQYKFNDARMSAVAVDGFNPRTLFSLPASQWLPIGLAFNPATSRFVWMDSAGTSEVVQANLNGSGAVSSPPLPGFCKGASLDAQGRIYFGSNNSVCRVNANGTGFVTLFTSPSTSFPVGAPKVDAANSHVYFGDDGEIRRMNLDGSNVKVVVRGISQARSIALDVAAGFIYWNDADTISDYTGRARLDGSDFTVLIDNSPSVVQSSGLIDLIVAPSLNAIFTVDELTQTVHRRALDGSSDTVIFQAQNDRNPSGIALSTGEPVQALLDCNGNGLHDDLDLAAGAPDCDNNGVIDTCQTNPCPARTFLLDQGSRADLSTAKAIGELSVWQAFQPFDVPADGWSIAELGVDGFTVNYHDGSGFTVTIFPDSGSGDRPDESTPLASAQGNFRFNTNYQNWVYLPLSVQLPQGRFWAQFASTAPTTYPNTYHGGLNLGQSGLPSVSRGSSGNFSPPGSPVALRLVEAPPACPADFNGDQFVDLFDYDDFVNCFETSSCPAGSSADFNSDGFVDFFDYDSFVLAFELGC